MRKANVMCFTETFLQPQQQLVGNDLPMQEECMVFRMDRLQTSSEDLTKGGIMMICPKALHPVRISIHHPPQLEVVSVTAISTHSDCKMCIVTVYR